MLSKTVSNRLLWIVLPLLLLPLAWKLADWAVFSAVFQADLQACQQAVGQGACWGVVAEKWRVVLFGRYPLEEQWRAGSVAVAWTLLLFSTAARLLTARWLALAWALFLPLAWLLMAGGALGGALVLEPVPTSLWGGLPLTLIISTVGFGLAFPLALLLALGRRSRIRLLSWTCTLYIEVLRALPLVAVLFLAAFVVPLWLPAGGVAETLDLLTRVLLTIALFSAAYLAEVLRGGLQAVPQGQHMAALALGLNTVQSHVQVVLPQAIRACLPSLLNSFVTLFKECSLVAIVALFELTGALSLALAGDVNWRNFYLEGYLFIALIYWAYCFGLSKTVK